MMLEAQRKKVIEIALKVQSEKLVPLTFGNFSVRDKETGYICITPSGMEYPSLMSEDVTVVDVNATIIDGKRKPSIETPMHCAVYRKRPDVNGIVHTHSVFATAWASCDEAIPVLTEELAALVGGSVECAPYKPMGSIELAETASEWLKDKYVVLLANHGVLAVGPDIDIAYANAVIVEEGARVAFYSKQIGVMKFIPDEECKRLRKWTIERYGQK